MKELPILSLIISLPLLTTLFLLFFVRFGGKNNKFVYARYVALLGSLLTLIASIYLLFTFNPNQVGYQFVETYQIFNLKSFEYSVGVDGISVYFVLLTTILSFLAIFYSVNKINYNVKTYILNFLLIEFCSLGVFCSINLLLFYSFFELTLVPMYFIIGIWGGENRVYASIKFFLYTFFGSLFFLAVIVYLCLASDTTLSLINLKLRAQNLSFEMQHYLWAASFITFAVKTPMIPLHTWLPDAHVQAPTAGSVLLAGILLKIGGYGLIRICLELFPAISFYHQDSAIILGLVAIIYGSFVAFRQTDIKKLIAYSSIAHMGYVTAAIFSLTAIGIEAAIFQMLSHGIISAGLFFAVGMMYEKMHTKDINAYGGLAKNMPILATCLMLLVFGNIGVPGTSGFIGEFLSLVGVFSYNKIYAASAASGIVLSSIYMLNFYRKVALGPTSHQVAKISDIKYKDCFILTSLVALMIIMGIFPNIINDLSFISTIHIEEMLNSYTK
jgi:NADH-quinone oxidoreductase subunit M